MNANTRKATFLMTLMAALVFIVGSSTNGHADPLIDPNFFVCPSGAAMGTCGGDPNVIGQTTFGIYVDTPAGPQDPFLLILGVPSTSGGLAQAAPTISTVNGLSTGQLGGTNVYSGSWNVATGVPTTLGTDGVAGHFTASQSGSIESFIGLNPQGNGSENATNWFDTANSGARLTNELGYDPSFYSLYVYTISATLPAKTLESVTFSTNIPTGSYVLGYGQDPKHVYATPFTTSGFVNSVPEPSSLLLIGLGLLGLVSIRPKRKEQTA